MTLFQRGMKGDRFFAGFLPHGKWISILIILSFAQLINCKKENDDSILPNPVTDDVLRTGAPRIALTPERLDELKTKLGTPQWSDLIGRMDQSVSSGKPEYGFGAFHFAVAYAVTQEKKFANMAKQLISRIINEPGYCDVTSSYLRAPDCTGQVALAADVLFAELTDEEKTRIFDYLETNARNIVEINGWSGWGWQQGNPAFRQLNNYYPGHLQTILHYALLAYNHRELARQYYKLIVEEELPAALKMMSTELRGGHGAEGTWYDDKLYGHYAEVVLMIREATGGKVDFGKEYATVFSDYVKFRIYSFNPTLLENGKPQLYHLATGDQPAIAGAKAIDLARLRLWLLMDVLKNTSQPEAAGFVKYFEQEVNFEAKGWQREYQLYHLLHFDNAVPLADYTQKLNRAYLSSGKGVAHYRTGWGSDALTATIHFAPGQGQRNSHWHFGEGAFYIWYKGWQADHLNRVGGSGIRQETGLMNTLLINSDERSQGVGDAKILSFRGDDSFMAVKGDLTATYGNKLERFERTFIITDKVMSVYDYVKKKSTGDVINFIVTNENGFHVNANEPGKYTAGNGLGRLTVKTMMPAGGNALLQPMRLKIDFNSTESELHILHAMEGGDDGSSSASMLLLESVHSDAGSFSGTQFIQLNHSFVHIVNKTDTPASVVGYNAGFSLGPVAHVITGMSAGNYRIKKDNLLVKEVKVDESGILNFQTGSGGAITIQK